MGTASRMARPIRESRPIRTIAYAALVSSLLLASSLANAAGPSFTNSRHLQKVPTDPCDTIITPSLADSSNQLRNMLNDTSRRVFCVRPGDYRAAGQLLLTSSGNIAARRILRFDTPNPSETAIQRSERAIFESIQINRARWWVIQGLTILPRDETRPSYILISGGDRNVIDGNLIDGIEHWNAGSAIGVKIQGTGGDPSVYNTVQRNVIRNGDQSWNASDYTGVAIAAAREIGEANDYNVVADNEIIDWGDGVAISGLTKDCSEPEVQHGTIVDGNDIYITAAKRVDCTTGARDPNGQCSCAENGVDNKSNPGPDPADWTRVTNNRTWGFRPTTDAVACGGSGSNGQAISSGSNCVGHVLVANNVVSDATIGISIVGPSWIVAGNLLFDIRESEITGVYQTRAISPTVWGSDIRIQWNTVVGSDAAYYALSSDTDTRCNAVVDDAAVAGFNGQRGPNHTTEKNFLYHAPQQNFLGNTNAFYPTAADSRNGTYCFWRRRWTDPERVCVPHAGTRPDSPHAEDVASCDPAIAAPFGLSEISYVPEPDAAALAVVGWLTVVALAHRR